VSSSLDLARIRGLCFDLDGTLVETDDAVTARLAGLLRSIRILLPLRDPTAAARRVVMAAESPANAALALIDRLGLDEALAPVLDRLHQARGLGPASAFQPVPGALEALAGLAPRYPMGLITSRESRSVEAFLDTFNLQGVFLCVASARSTRRGKPHPEPVRWAADCLGLAPRMCLMVGDTTIDIRAARAAGAQSAAVLSGFGERRELERAGADVVLESVADLPGLLLGQGKGSE
jgi:HAD superfamily hydrolase (TIGR01549 family)